MAAGRLRTLSAKPAPRGPLVGLAIGLPILVAGFLIPGRLVLPATVPALDAASVAFLLLTAALAAEDAFLRADRRSLPIAAIGVAAAVMWVTHLVLFPGSVPAIDQPFANNATSNVFLALNLTVPFMLAIALLQKGGPLPRPLRAVALSIAAGLAAGIAVTLVALLTSVYVPTVTSGGRFNAIETWVGAASLVPAVVGLAVYLSGRRGDERMSAGVAAALVIAGCNSVALVVLEARYTAPWYADHILSFLPAVVLATGQMTIFARALRAEQRSGTTLRTSLDMAEAMARQQELGSLIERLMAGAMAAVDADRATLMAIEGDGLRIEASIDSSGTPAPTGRRLPLTSLQVDGVPIVVEAMRRQKAIATPAYDRSLLAPDHAASVAGVRHYITWPLLLGGEVDAVLFLARRRDVPFDAGDADLLSEFATIAALLLRNARLLRTAEAASVAKTSFLKLAAHELRTPVSVIRGYLDLLAGGDLGPVAESQRLALGTLNSKARELADQVEQLLIASRLDAGTVGTPELYQPFDLDEAAAAAVDRARPRVQLLGAKLELATNGPVPVSGSPAEVALILDNLLNNALTYSRPPADIRVEVAADGGPVVRVRDRGIGIAPEEHGRIFDQFHRVDRADFAYPGGTGLGLFIARQLSEANGGSLELEWSEVDAGSCFALRLPAKAS